jgi:DNA-binding transcriptional MerR regulator
MATDGPAPDRETLSIGQLADRVGVNAETVRYYERRGLLAAPSRSPAGYRRYTADDVERMELLRRAKDLGFTLTEIAELLDAAGSGSAEDVVAAVGHKLRDVEERIAGLEATRCRLRLLAQACEHGDHAACLALRADEPPATSTRTAP